jgi:hypothetical protein
MGRRQCRRARHRLVQSMKRGWRMPEGATPNDRCRDERHDGNPKHQDCPAHPRRPGCRETDTRHDRQPGSEAQRAFRQQYQHRPGQDRACGRRDPVGKAARRRLAHAAMPSHHTPASCLRLPPISLSRDFSLVAPGSSIVSEESTTSLHFGSGEALAAYASCQFHHL